MRDREKLEALEAKREYDRNGILAEIAIALTPGSPAYVRRLRDEAALARFGRLRDRTNLLKEDVRDVVSGANFMVGLLGYKIPEEDEGGA